MKLTQNEVAIVELVRKGMTNGEIAAARGTQEQTVKNQLRLIFAKVGVKHRTQLHSIRLRRAA